MTASQALVLGLAFGVGMMAAHFVGTRIESVASRSFFLTDVEARIAECRARAGTWSTDEHGRFRSCFGSKAHE